MVMQTGDKNWQSAHYVNFQQPENTHYVEFEVILSPSMGDWSGEW